MRQPFAVIRGGGGQPPSSAPLLAFDRGVIEAVFAPLAAQRIFCAWKAVERDGKATKLPINVFSGQNAIPGKLPTFAALEQAIAFAEARGWGVGVHTGPLSGVYGIDLDSVVEPNTGAVASAWARDLIAACATYTEISPSGTGVKAFFRVPEGIVPPTFAVHDPAPPVLSTRTHAQTDAVAKWANGYFTVTGRHLRGTPMPLAALTPEAVARIKAVVARGRASGAANASAGPAGGRDRSRDFFAACLIAARAGRGYDELLEQLEAEDTELAAYAHEIRKKGQTKGQHDWGRAAASVEQQAGRAVYDTGSDAEIAEHLLAKLADESGQPVVCAEDRLYIWAKTHWRAFEDSETARLIYAVNGSFFGEKGRVKISDSRERSISKIMRKKAHSPGFFDKEPEGVNVANGFVVLSKDSPPVLFEHHPDQRRRFCEPWEWWPDLDWRGSPLLGKLIDGCFGKEGAPDANEDRAERIALMAEFLGVAAAQIATKLKKPKALIFYGLTANNGKSVWLQLARCMLPADVVSAVPITKFSERQECAHLAGKTLNACDELGRRDLTDSATFKKIITGDQTGARANNKDPFDFKPKALHAFTTNELPAFSGGVDNGLMRRLIILEFTRVIPDAEVIPDIAERIVAEEGRALLAFAIEGAARAWRNQGFTVPPTAVEELEEYRRQENLVDTWLEERTELVEGHRETIDKLHTDFRDWARRKGIHENHIDGPKQFSPKVRRAAPFVKRAKSGKVRSLAGLRLLPLFPEPWGGGAS